MFNFLCLLVAFVGLLFARSALKARKRYWKARYQYVKYHRFIEDTERIKNNKRFFSGNRKSRNKRSSNGNRFQQKNVKVGDKNV